MSISINLFLIDRVLLFKKHFITEKICKFNENAFAVKKFRVFSRVRKRREKFNEMWFLEHYKNIFKNSLSLTNKISNNLSHSMICIFNFLVKIIFCVRSFM